jgi:glycosyltransferase involved in cell wall biosynthesis
MEAQSLEEVEQQQIILNEPAFSSAKPFIVAGIPAFNEEHSIARVVMETQKFSDAVIVCDDGSSDLTAEIAKRLGADVITHKQNLGYGAAIRSLFERAIEFGADVLVTLDADGQHNPAEIPRVIEPVVAGRADVVIASRFADANGTKEMPLYRQVGAKLITKMVNGSAKNGVGDAQSGFRAYNREALGLLSLVEVGMGASIEILLEASRHNLKICEVPSTCKYKNGAVATSTVDPFTHGVSVVMSIIRLIVEERPLTILGLPGLLILFAGIGFGVWMLQIYAKNQVIVTNIALASIAFVLVSFFLLSTAITLYAISRLSRKMGGKR